MKASAPSRSPLYRSAWTARALSLLLMVVLAAVRPGSAQDEAEAFQSGLTAVEQFVAERKWKEADEALSRLLEQHARRDYARARRVEIVALHRACAFGLAHGDISPADAVTGKLIRHAPSSGWLKIEYTPTTLEGDFEKSRVGHFFTGYFVGPYTLTIEGRDYPEPSASFYVGVRRDGEDAYNVQMEWTKGRKEERFKVYLFFSQKEYLTYTRRVMGTSPTNTAGLYSPHLKQLLIWNLPDRKQMLQTVRHEGFHQYLDRVLPDPPTWLNEGLAEYHETASYRNGRWETEERRPDHLTYREKFVPLTEFFRQSSGEFYQRGLRNYAQAWAVVRFLKHGPDPYPSLFTRLFKELRTADRGADVVDRVFSTVKPEQMEEDFRAFVKGL